MARVACQAQRQTKREELHLRLGAWPSSDAANQMAASALAAAAPTDHQAPRQVHCGTAKEGCPPYQSARRLAAPPSTIHAGRAPRQAARHKLNTPQDGFQSARFLARWFHRRRKKPAATRPLGIGTVESRSSQASQLAAQLACRTEKRILHRFFRRAQCVADGAQFQSLVVLQFEYHALARR